MCCSTLQRSFIHLYELMKFLVTLIINSYIVDLLLVLFVSKSDSSSQFDSNVKKIQAPTFAIVLSVGYAKHCNRAIWSAQEEYNVSIDVCAGLDVSLGRRVCRSCIYSPFVFLFRRFFQSFLQHSFYCISVFSALRHVSTYWCS